MRPKPLYEIGEKVSLIGVYRKDKELQCLSYIGVVVGRDTSEQALTIGASYNVYRIDGVGTYGEGALTKI